MSRECPLKKGVLINVVIFAALGIHSFVANISEKRKESEVVYNSGKHKLQEMGQQEELFSH